MRLSVIGTGYLGVTHAAAMAKIGHDVVGVDVDTAKIAALRAGSVPFYEPELDALLGQQLAAGRLRFTSSLNEAADVADVHFVCVGTPQRQGEYAADLSALDGVIGDLAARVRPGATVIGKSTVPVGTAARLADEIEKAGARLLWNPEFLREGFAVQDTLEPDRIVVGARHDDDVAVLRAVYAPILERGVPWIVSDFATAELVKVAANSFLATKISFINAMAEVCEAAGADVTVLAEAIGHDARIGRRFLNAGLGFGGGCLPKDIRAFMARAGELGVDQAVSFLKHVDEINLRRRARMVDLARQLCGGSLAGRRVGILGVAFKPHSDDIRDSPALDVAYAIQREGAAVRAYDPKAMDNARVLHPTVEYSASAQAAVEDSDVVLHLTEWPEFRELSPADLATLVRRSNIVDGRNALDPDPWRAAGWHYRALGRP